MRQRGESPRKRQRKVKLVWGILFVAETDKSILKTQEHSRVNVESEMEIQRATAAVFGVEVNFPNLT